MIPASYAYNTNLARQQIFPKWKLLSFRLIDDIDTWATIINGDYTQVPTDLTSYVTRIEYSFDRLQVTMSDTADLLFHPDAGPLRVCLKQGRIIRLMEGFEGLAESEWVTTFSGTVEGSYSWQFQRGEYIPIQFSVFSRANNQAWKRRNVTSNNYTVGSDWSSMFENIVKDVMLLTDDEVVAPTPWGVLFDKNSNQVVNYPPWDAIEQLAFGIQAKPWFNGRGQLALYLTTQNRVTIVLPDNNYLRKYDAKGGAAETINKVLLTYLSNDLSRVEGPDQLLGSAMITTGFFRPSQSMEVYYSDERKTRSDNPRFIVIQSVNSGLLPVGDESMTKFDEFHVRIDVEISVWVIVLAAYLLYLYLAASIIPDGVGLVATIPIGRVIQAIVLVGILIIMMSIGTGQYEVWGTPYELVYLEKQAIAQKTGVQFWEERELGIRNDFVSTTEQADALAVAALHYEVMKENPRSLLLRYDPRIEPGDIIQLSTTVKVYVESVRRTIMRDSTDSGIMMVDGYRTVL